MLFLTHLKLRFYVRKHFPQQFCLFLSFFILREREREKERENDWGKGREEGGQRIQSGFCADSREPNEGLELTNCKIMT